MTTADELRERWARGDRADITALIDGGYIDLDDDGTPLDDQWELIAEQLEADNSPEAEPEPVEADLPRDVTPGVLAEIDADERDWRELQAIECALDGLDLARRRVDALTGDVALYRDQADQVEALDRWLGAAVEIRRHADGLAKAAETELHKAIRAAIDAKVSIPKIASRVGLSRERVYQIRDGRRGPRRPTDPTVRGDAS